jgi:major intracellular serine protease
MDNENKIMLNDLIIGEANAVPSIDEFNFLDQTGRKLFWNQGYKGQNVIVAVVDTGVNANHSELKGKVLPGKNFAKDYVTDPDTADFDNNGHGSHVAATIAGQLKCGVAPMVKILPVKVLDSQGTLWLTSWLTDGLEYVYNWRGVNGEKVDIVNMSLGGIGWFDTDIAILKEKIQKLNSIGITVIVAAGNTGKEETNYYPAALDEVIAVGAVDIKKQIAYFSTSGDMVDLCQIGVDVLSADYKNNFGYIKMSGTSMASPAVAGIAALIICKDKILNGIYNKTMASNALELSYYKELRNTTIDLGIVGTDKIYGTGFCTLNQRAMTTMQFWLGSDKLVVNGVEIKMDAPAQLINGRTFIPIRYFAENVGATVNYINATNPITVTV